MIPITISDLRNHPLVENSVSEVKNYMYSTEKC